MIILHKETIFQKIPDIMSTNVCLTCINQAFSRNQVLTIRCLWRVASLAGFKVLSILYTDLEGYQKLGQHAIIESSTTRS